MIHDVKPRTTFTVAVRRLGIASSIAVCALDVLYAVVLGAGLLSLRVSSEPIGDPYFTVMELLILVLMPLFVSMMVALQQWADPARRVHGTIAVVFTALLAGVTSSVHFVVLTVSRSPSVADLGGAPLLLAFEWPSVVYALDVLAWDLFFPLAAFAAAAVLSGDGLARWARLLMFTSGVLALAGLGGAVTGDMRIRNVGIVGYAVVFPVAACVLAVLFHRTPAYAGSAVPRE